MSTLTVPKFLKIYSFHSEKDAISFKKTKSKCYKLFIQKVFLEPSTTNFIDPLMLGF
jgi:hypothetical protein